MGNERAPALHPVVRLLATVGFLGYAPVAPGSVASLVLAVVLWFVAPEVTVSSPPADIGVAVLTSAAFVALAIWAAGVAERFLGKDSSRIVIDECAGLVIALLLLPKSLFVFSATFLLFRVFDVLKPFPAGRCERIPGGPGVVLDDLVAGAYANILVRLMLLGRGW